MWHKEKTRVQTRLTLFAALSQHNKKAAISDRLSQHCDIKRTQCCFFIYLFFIYLFSLRSLDCPGSSRPIPVYPVPSLSVTYNSLMYITSNLVRKRSDIPRRGSAKKVRRQRLTLSGVRTAPSSRAAGGRLQSLCAWQLCKVREIPECICVDAAIF